MSPFHRAQAWDHSCPQHHPQEPGLAFGPKTGVLPAGRAGCAVTTSLPRPEGQPALGGRGPQSFVANVPAVEPTTGARSPHAPTRSSGEPAARPGQCPAPPKQDAEAPALPPPIAACCQDLALAQSPRKPLCPVAVAGLPGALTPLHLQPQRRPLRGTSAPAHPAPVPATGPESLLPASTSRVPVPAPLVRRPSGCVVSTWTRRCVFPSGCPGPHHLPHR